MTGFTGKEIKKLINNMADAYIKEESKYSIESIACSSRFSFDLHEIEILKKGD